MTKTKSSRHWGVRESEFPVAVLAYVPVLVLRFGIGYLRVKAQRRRGVRTFRKTLIRAGMDPWIADRFAEEFESFGSLRRYLPRLPFMS